MSKNTEKTTESGKAKRAKNLIPWKPGESGNPAGYPKGQRHYKTIYLEALRRIAASTGHKPEEVEDAMTVRAIEKAIKGDIFFYKEINERIHGKIKDKMDLSSGGKTFADLMLAASNARKKRGKK